MDKRKKFKHLHKNRFWKSKIGGRLKGRVAEIFIGGLEAMDLTVSKVSTSRSGAKEGRHG